jgi:hypothetical protein
MRLPCLAASIRINDLLPYALLSLFIVCTSQPIVKLADGSAAIVTALLDAIQHVHLT